MNPQTNNRPQSSQHKPEAGAKTASQQSGRIGTGNKNQLNPDTTSQYQNGKVPLAEDQRQAFIQENHNKTHDKHEPKTDTENHTHDESAHYTKNDHITPKDEKTREHGSSMNKEEV